MAAQALILHISMMLLPAFAPPSTKSASPSPTAEEGATVASASAKTAATRHVIYEDDDISGEVLSPNGVQVGGHIAKTHKNMIGIRGTFVAELIRHSHDI